MQIQPLHDRVLIQPLEAETESKGGIIIPEAAQAKRARGIVIAVGPGKLDEEGKRIPMGVKDGDTVVYGKYAGTEIELHNEKFVIVREDDIVGILQNTDS